VRDDSPRRGADEPEDGSGGGGRTDGSTWRSIDRRTALATLGTVAIGGVAGCSGDGEPTGDASTAGAAAADTATATGTGSRPAVASAPPTRQFERRFEWPVDGVERVDDTLVVLTAPGIEATEGRVHVLDLATGDHEAFDAPSRPWGVRIDVDRSLAVVHCHSNADGGDGALFRVDLDARSATVTHEFPGFPYLIPYGRFDGSVVLVANSRDDGSGDHSGTVLQYDVASETVEWERTFEHRLHYPDMDDERVYLTGDSAGGGGGRLLALGRDDGETLWSSSLATPATTPRRTPSGIYLSTSMSYENPGSETTPMLWAFDVEGNERWAVELDVTPATTIDYSDDGGVLALSGWTGDPRESDRRLLVFDRSGEELWTTDLDEGYRSHQLLSEAMYVWTDASFSTYAAGSGDRIATLDRGPTRYPSWQRDVVYLPASTTLVAADTRSGTEHWTREFDAELDRVWVDGDYLFVAMGRRLVGLQSNG